MMHLVHRLARLRHPTALAAILTALALVALGVSAWFLADTQNRQRRDLRDRYADRTAVAASLIDSLFNVAFQGQRQQAAERYSGSTIPRERLDAVVKQQQLAYTMFVDPSGRVIQEWAVPGLRHAWKAVRLPNGRTLASTGYGAFLVELNADGSVARRFAEKEAMPPALNARFYATFQLLPNGHIVLANWQGHGPGHGASGVQLFELDPAGAVVWQWSDASLISSLQGVLILDGLDTSQLHDERSGVMAPLEIEREQSSHDHRPI